MIRREFLNRSIHLAIVSGLSVELTGCGTVLHSERVGQPHSRDIDWKIAGLNGLGLILFFVPGVIAFVVDFYTGAIYLPDESFGPIEPGHHPTQQQLSQISGRNPRSINRRNAASARDGHHSLASHTGSFEQIKLAVEDRDLASVERIVAKKTGHRFRIDDGSARVSQLADLDHFAYSYRRHLNDPHFGTTTKRFLEDLPSA